MQRKSLQTQRLYWCGRLMSGNRRGAGWWPHPASLSRSNLHDMHTHNMWLIQSAIRGFQEFYRKGVGPACLPLAMCSILCDNTCLTIDHAYLFV